MMNAYQNRAGIVSLIFETISDCIKNSWLKSWFLCKNSEFYTEKSSTSSGSVGTMSFPTDFNQTFGIDS